MQFHKWIRSGTQAVSNESFDHILTTQGCDHSENTRREWANNFEELPTKTYICTMLNSTISQIKASWKPCSVHDSKFIRHHSHHVRVCPFGEHPPRNTHKNSTCQTKLLALYMLYGEFLQINTQWNPHSDSWYTRHPSHHVMLNPLRECLFPTQ